MKNHLHLFLLFLMSVNLFSQNILKTVEGDEILFNSLGQKSNSTFMTVNTSEQSTELKSVIKLKNKEGALPKEFLSLGIKAKASDGIATVFKNGRINSGVNFNISFFKVNLFYNEKHKNIDFFSINAGYNSNKYTLFDKEKTFDDQVEKVNFSGYDFSFNYNVLIKGKHLMTLIMGYSDKSNYNDLDKIDIKDYYDVINPNDNSIREIGTTSTARIGNYKEFNSYPVKIGYTLCPSEHEAEATKLKFGFTVYYSSFFGDNIPRHDLGSILFFTKQNEKSGIRVPLFGIGLLATDISNNLDSESNFSKRVIMNLTTTFNLFNF